MNFPNIINSPCIPTVPPPPNPQCSDPVFALLNPDLCANAAYLRVKPGVLLTCALGSVQFKVFSVTAGVETELTSGVTWTVSDTSVALIGAISGNATGLSAGLVTVTATANGMSATASLTVLAGLNCCSQNSVATMLVVDKSHSMSLQFGGGYATKQAFADSVASQYASQTNTQKDEIGLIEFDTTPTTDATLTSDAAAVAAQASGIVNTVNLTGIGAALQAAIAILAPSAADTKVIVLVTDGQDKDTTISAPTVAQGFTNGGGILICVGVRASGDGFSLLNAIATGGFFVNAYPANAADAVAQVFGIKGYICAGSCTPAGNTYVNAPQLEYRSFINWNATGNINLFGPGLLDVLPGNGLYVGLGYQGVMTSKTSFVFTAGKQYQLSFYLAGNQVNDFGTQTVTAQIGDGTQFKQVILLPGYKQGLQKYSFNFTPQVTVTAPIVLTSGAASTDLLDGIYFGPLLTDVNLQDVTDLTQMFDDNFDGENLQYVPPACGPATIFSHGQYFSYYGYSCYGYGCLSEPPGVQAADPNPLPDIEAGGYVPPTTYTATAQFPAQCPNGTVQGALLATQVLSSADQQDYLLPQAFPSTALLFANVTPSAVSPDATVVVHLFGTLDGTNYVTVGVTNPFQAVAGQSVPILISLPGNYVGLSANVSSQNGGAGLGSGTYTVSAFGPAASNTGITKSATATSLLSYADAYAQALQAATIAANTALAAVGCITQYVSTQSVTVKCAVGQYDGNGGMGSTASATATSFVSQALADSQAIALATAAAQALLNCTYSNNTAPIAIPAPQFQAAGLGAASPFPSVQFLSGLAGHVSRIRVNINGLIHQNQSDINALLVGPSGQAVVLMCKCGGNNILAQSNITLDSNSATPLPQLTTMSSGSFKPTSYGVPAFSAPAPQSGYAADFTGIIGQAAGLVNGSWSLWFQDVVALDIGALNNGWSIQIDAV